MPGFQSKNVVVAMERTIAMDALIIMNVLAISALSVEQYTGHKMQTWL